MRICRLEMNRHGIVYITTNTSRDKMVAEGIAAVTGNHIKMVDVARRVGRQLQRRIRQEIGIPCRPLTAECVPLVEIAQFHAEDSRLEFVQAGITSAGFGCDIFRPPAIEAQPAQLFRQRSVVGDERPAIAQRAQVLLG